MHSPIDMFNTPPQPSVLLSRDGGSEPAKETAVLTVLAERAEIKKTEEQVGTVRVRKATTSQLVTLPLVETREVVDTKRVLVERRVEATEPPHYRDDVWVVPVYEERLVKQLFLVEELHVTKRSHTFARNEEVTLRREELVTERFDTLTQQWVVDPS